ncbi:hypothetical protein SJ05684_c19860 [Sinorhizobium sojae CCBAU 05684]|uniref:Uncharacterized protein n=1 Tax=Sinorhizobium sojae CCBAU 05684 TaxID=716928 RepID=A0A249PBY4_9HYPH|nr:hypothetical protein SJ05684_c19860 [Sinorhizobium sojae CCBAU 05684]
MLSVKVSENAEGDVGEVAHIDVDTPEATIAAGGVLER